MSIKQLAKQKNERGKQAREIIRENKKADRCCDWCHACGKIMDDDGRCGCTNKDAFGI